MITVGELIEKLKCFDPSLPVAIADWQESYRYPCSAEAGIVKQVHGTYTENYGPMTEGDYVQIGDDSC